MMLRHALLACTLATLALAQRPGKAAYDDFTAWRKTAGLHDWSAAVERYRAKLVSDKLGDDAVERAMRGIDAYGEAELYDKVYAGAPTFNTKPNQLLVDAVKGLRPGAALEVAMGSGRNGLYLASQGWKVTGFDVSAVGVRAAAGQARERGLHIDAVHSSDEDFDFGENRWDLIAVIYAIEKRSIRRVARALKPGGVVVVEAGYKSASGAHFEYDSNELPGIFDGFEIVKYEEPVAVADWSQKPIRLVRLIARKPR
jgi:SAM-dependent methyltransferase